MKENTPTIEQIKKRIYDQTKKELYSLTEREWDVEGKDFDPLINILISSFAAEFKELYYEINQSDERLLEKLINYLLPEKNNIAIPGHLLIHAFTESNNCFIDKEHILNASFDNNDKKFSFAPIYPIHLIPADLFFWASDYSFYSKVDNQFKTATTNSVQNKTFCLGLEHNAGFSWQQVPNFLIYFSYSLNSSPHFQDILIDILLKSSWKINGKDVSIQRFSSTKKIDDHYNPFEYIKQQIIDKNYYNLLQINTNSNIPTLDNETLQATSNSLTVTDQNVVQLFDSVREKGKKASVIEIDLHSTLSQDFFDKTLACHLNCFPIMNMLLKEKDDEDTYFNKSSLNAIKLDVGKEFLDIHQINLKGDRKNTFEYSLLSDFKPNSIGHYTLYKGWERKSDLPTWDSLDHLLTIIKRENKQQTFQQNFLKSKIRLEDFTQIIHDLSKLSEFSFSSKDIYVFLNVGDTKDKPKRIEVRYWISQNHLLQTVEDFEQLILESSKIDFTKIYPITKLNKGTFAKNNIEYTEQLRSSILKHEKIVTQIDLAESAYVFLQKYIPSINLNDILIKKGLANDPRFGYCRSIVVNINVKEEFLDNKELVTMLQSTLASKLNRQSTFILPIFVTFQIYRNGL